MTSRPPGCLSECESNETSADKLCVAPVHISVFAMKMVFL